MPVPAPVQRLSDTVGGTPVVRLRRAAGSADVRVKLETRSPNACFADRVARALVALAPPPGGSTMLDGGDGVLAVSLAQLAAEYGASLRAFVPESSSLEVRQSLAVLGAEVVLTAHSAGPAGALARARADGPVLADQFPEAFGAAAEALAEELWATVGDDGGRCDAVVISAGGAPLARTLARRAGCEVLAAAVDDGRTAHRLAGLPFLAEVGAYGRVVDDAFGWTWQQTLAREEGLLLSPASAAAVGLAVARAQQTAGSRVYAVAADTGERYFSLGQTFA